MADFFPAVVTFNLKMGKDSVKATIVEKGDELESCIKKLWKAVKSSPLVGFDLKTRTVRPNNTASRHILFLYVKNCCLVILIDPSKTISRYLQEFFSSQRACFVGKNVSEKVEILLELCSSKQFVHTAMDASTGSPAGGSFISSSSKALFTGYTVRVKSFSSSYSLNALAAAVDVILLAARTVKNPELKSCTCLVQVVKSIGLSLKIQEFKEAAGSSSSSGGNDPPADWTDLCLSEKDMMIEMREAYLCYKIADFCRKKS